MVDGKTHKGGMLSPRSSDGEKGSYARILGEKYLNRLLDILAEANEANIEEWRTMFTLSHDIIQKMEADIDRRIDPKQITETEINAYNHIELTIPAEQALRGLFNELGEKDYVVSYNKDSQAFEVELHSSELNISVPLGDVVRKKWETGECFAKAALICGSDLFLMLDERKRREAHYTEELLKLAMPNLRKIAGQDQGRFEILKNHYITVIENQIALYDEGREHSEAGHAKWNRDEFLAQHNELATHKSVSHYIDMLYSAYCHGFAKLNGDYLFSGKGGIYLPAIQ